ncbi:hypothetical protein [Bacteroides timonensis]|uniref:hypothetical protein n=1 Tax=Bacteroides timonensis TaxID=1470345 RepID=UPI0004AE6AFF|nr:hypothetical protein [Bacteroides timonensis]
MTETNKSPNTPLSGEEVKVGHEEVKLDRPTGEKKTSNASRLLGYEAVGGNAEESKSFFDIIYDKIVDVIGGDDPHQYLCITLPGQALSPEDFTYDYKNNAPKGPTIEANESRLANKLFDPGHVVGADNGLMLPYQYRSALDTLTPKLNEKIAVAKNQLRELLLTIYPYDFGEGDNKTYTLQEVFYRLYDEYVAEEKAWAEKQNAAKERLRKLFPGTDAASNMKYNDAYLEWYETVAQSQITALNEKRAKVLSVFSPNDMDILAGILDSGSGAELEQARETLQNTQKLTPDGGFVYPVKFNPTNWFELLGTSFTPIDLLKTPEALSMLLTGLSSRRIALDARINEIVALIPEDSTVSSLKKEVDDAKGKLDEAETNLITKYGEGIKTVITTALDVASMFESIPNGILAKLAAGHKLNEGQKIEDLIDDLSKAVKEGVNAQNDLVNASQQLSVALMNVINAKNLSSLKNLLSPMKEQLDRLDMQIRDIQTQIQISSALKSKDNATASISDVTPPEVPTGFTQIIIETSASTMDTQTTKYASASNSTCGVNFWFGGYSSKEESSSSGFDSMTNNQSSTVRLGMNVAKVGIEREWFNPGVFVLSKDMFNVSTSRVSPSEDYTEMTDERLKDMSGSYILPCYPVAMLIARDISLQITSEDSSFSSFAHSTEEHASHGGGFLFFSGSKSSNSSFSTSGAHSEAREKSVTVKFDTPQIIGYYLQATPADKSVILDDISETEAAAGYVTIAKFVNDYKEMLEKMKQKPEQCQKGNV